MENEEMVVKCEIELDRIFFPKGKTTVPSGEYAIFSAIITKSIENCGNLHGRIKLKGNVSELNYCESYNVTCRLADQNAKYGDTYEILFMNRIVDLKDEIKQRNFLMSILNENTVQRLFDMYGDKVIELLDNKDIDSLSKVKGVGVKSAMKLIEKYESCKDYGEVYAELGHLGLSKTLIKRLVDYYKSPDTLIDVIKTNPYVLVEVDSIGFKKADEIASKCGITGNNPNRVKGCIIYILTTNGASGRSYLHYAELLQNINNYIGYVDEDVINQVAQNLIEEKLVHVSQDGQFIGLSKFHDLEKNIAIELKRLLTAENRVEVEDIENIIKETEKEQGFEFTEEQRDAIRLFNGNNVMVMTGGAGVGKSSTVRGMYNLVKDNYNAIGVALAGKAALVLQESTGMETSTIHRLLKYQNGKFLYNKDYKLDIDAIFIDEASMINGELMLSLLEAIPDGAKVMFSGDVQQLTPIGSCQVFYDLLNSKLIPKAWLTKPHRQALKSGIITTSMSAIQQKQIFDTSFEGLQTRGELNDMDLLIYKDKTGKVDEVVNIYMKYYKECQDIMDIEIVTPMKLRGDLSVYNLNTLIQSKINPINPKRKHIVNSLDKDHAYTIQVGDKVMNTANKYDVPLANSTTIDEFGFEHVERTDVFNGNFGIVKDIDDGFVTIDFVGIGEVIFDTKDSKSLWLGYASTISKSQGSGFAYTIVTIDSSAYIMLNAELLYTGITRAKKRCALVGENKAIRQAIKKRETKTKQTYLGYLLMENS